LELGGKRRKNGKGADEVDGNKKLVGKVFVWKKGKEKAS